MRIGTPYPAGGRAPMRRSAFVVAAPLWLLVGAVVAAPVAGAHPEDVIVLLNSTPAQAGDARSINPSSTVQSVLAASAETQSITPTHIYGSALSGFSASLSASQQQALAADPRVEAIVPDELTQVADDVVEDTRANTDSSIDTSPGASPD